MAVKRSSQRRLAGVMAATGVVLALGAGTALPAFAAPAEGKIENASAAEAIKNSYIVVLEEEAPDAGSSAGKSLAKRFGADVEHTYKEALNGYAVTMTEAEAKKFAADPAVKSVVQNEVVHAVGTQTGATWGLDRLDQAALPLNGSYTYPDSAGQGVTA
ncbi:S8 family serine peptidase, partial [Streptomyces sp. NPDC059506]|uniref:S8 family serine peptidase n=1 Tax=Streptomyces sp. NPDC059506 TaxID=3347751 RepID=UPI0036ADEDC8